MQPWERVSREIGVDDIVDRLVEISGSDFTSLLLEVTKRRASSIRAAQVVDQRMSDRFVAPAAVDLRRLQEVEQTLLAGVPEEFDTVVLSPVSPTGLHATVAGVAQNRVLSTIRRTDVAADPTAGLALEAAVRRRTTNRLPVTRLATCSA